MNHDIIKHMTYRYKKACQAYRTSGGPDRLNYSYVMRLLAKGH